jgi:hypothetical protein
MEGLGTRKRFFLDGEPNRVLGGSQFSLRCIVGKRFVAGKCRVEAMSGEEPV